MSLPVPCPCPCHSLCFCPCPFSCSAPAPVQSLSISIFMIMIMNMFMDIDMDRDRNWDRNRCRDRDTILLNYIPHPSPSSLNTVNADVKDTTLLEDIDKNISVIRIQFFRNCTQSFWTTNWGQCQGSLGYKWERSSKLGLIETSVRTPAGHFRADFYCK